MRRAIRFGDLAIGERFYYFPDANVVWQKTSDNAPPNPNHVYVNDSGVATRHDYCINLDDKVYMDDVEEIIP